ncbi:oxidoreductase [Shigella sonnei]|nr:oxidoreductase [Shigella sonnei]
MTGGKYDDTYLFANSGNDSNLLIVFYVQIMPDDFVMQLHRF